MKFKILVKTDSEQWWEEYDKNTTNPNKWAIETIQHFNATLKPHEKFRSLVDVQIIDESNNQHSWVKRTDGMSVNFRGSIVDLMRCENCGITGKRIGLSGFVKVDSKYKKKAYLRCDTAKIQKYKDNL